MFADNESMILKRLAPDARVLDVGGWACPFNRADVVLDAQPYESRGYYKSLGGLAHQGGDSEWFTKQTWVQRDICDRTPWPFSTDEFDFVICSQTLEDLRDPLWVCSELVRVGKAGYIEVPSRIAECTRGIEHSGMVGFSHHRWLVDIQDNHLTFTPKYHIIHAHWRLSFPRRQLKRLTAEERVTFLFWKREFTYEEKRFEGTATQIAEYARFVEERAPYNKALVATDLFVRRAISVPREALRVLRRRLR